MYSTEMPTTADMHADMAGSDDNSAD
jgi:hypothetical protein